MEDRAMRPGRRLIQTFGPIAVLLALAVTASLVARDAAAVRRSMEHGDLVFLEGQPVYERLWSLETTLPYASDLFAIDDDLLYRHALRKYAAEDRRQRGRFNFSNPGLRAEAQAALSIAEQSQLSAARRSRLANLQGVISYDETLSNPLDASGLAAQALEHFTRAVKIDPTNVEAKYNLEYLLRLGDPDANPARQRAFVPADIEARSTPGGGGERRGEGY
jgi:tetratricopeptide (TPR) repeat protein